MGLGHFSPSEVETVSICVRNGAGDQMSGPLRGDEISLWATLCTVALEAVSGVVNSKRAERVGCMSTLQGL